MSEPVYRQISDDLLRQIGTGQLLEGDRLPTERELAKLYDVAVGTVRRGLEELQAQGLLERRQGSGNYVCSVREAGGLYGFFRLEKPGGGGLPGAEVLSVDDVTAPDGAAFARAHRIRRRRRLDGEAVAVEEIFVDAALTPGLDCKALGASLYQTYLAGWGLRIVRIEDRCAAGALPAWGATALELTSGQPMGQVLRRAWDHEGREVEYSVTWFDPERAHHVTRTR
ncbi:GntR family transcriptional regulator [Palleronia caenipelagi]|uniref:GntR family transcriptional regulator n=1 Tax=Palleronia caenipelagi TaxID=2489174 RepID=A0A547Q9K1_9RHOB|nr:GntR family transcriptional regulator [Palleronia caenipelagi]TRD23032.1 GntR family transcriptional regulator [Palleronia caenipelagi]